MLGALCGLIFTAQALAYSVENVRWSVTADDKIIVEYDLVGNGTYEVTLSVSTDNGVTFHLQPRALTGDIGAKVEGGRGKRIVWDVFRDLKRLSGDVAVKVNAVSGNAGATGSGAAIQGPLPGLTFVPIPGGSFLMGSPEGEEGRHGDEGPQHRVTLQPFYMMTTEVTQAQWVALMGSNPSYFKGDDLPVEQVSWNDCQ
ncbi:MAG: formylglycine-generating enzyme family protein, partial [Calditrichota bacterium]